MLFLLSLIYINHFLWYSDRLTLVVIFVFFWNSPVIIRTTFSPLITTCYWSSCFPATRFCGFSVGVRCSVYIHMILRELSNTALAVFYSRVNELKTKTTRLSEDTWCCILRLCLIIYMPHSQTKCACEHHCTPSIPYISLHLNDSVINAANKTINSTVLQKLSINMHNDSMKCK